MPWSWYRHRPDGALWRSAGEVFQRDGQPCVAGLRPRLGYLNVSLPQSVVAQEYELVSEVICPACHGKGVLHDA